MSHQFLVSTFRSPIIYSFSFSPSTRTLTLLSTHPAASGHSWLSLSADKSRLYCTGWTDPPTLAAYRITPSEKGPSLELINTVQSPFLSGYVCCNSTTVFSASGPQVDVFPIDSSTGGFEKDGQTVQSCDFLEGRKQKDDGSQMDFGGLRNGGHSADLSPDGTKLYIADIGRNCIWTYHISPSSPLPLSLASKSPAKRGHDGPRHAWPHPNGTIVYSLQEHSSYVDVLELVGDTLEWRQGVSIIPEGDDCHNFWADEVRLSPDSLTLFASTRHLHPPSRGYLTSFSLLPSGLLACPTRSHIHQTSTSGGWANAIMPCPVVGEGGEVWLTLTDEEVGGVEIVEWTEVAGFEVVAGYGFNEGKREGEGKVGAAVAVWL